MEVNVNGNIVHWESDFDFVNNEQNIANGWGISAGDPFKLSVKIKGVKFIRFFVKRFSKKSTEISGYDFIFKIKGKKLKGLPIVFDIVETKEEGHNIIYLFMEQIAGNTLDNLHREGFTFLPSKLGVDLYSGLQSIFDNGFWFPDFDPKNFLQSDEGDFFIIDLDSTYPLSVLPRNSIFGAKDFWAPVYEFYRDNKNGGLKSTDLMHIKGDLLNHLNLIYLLGLYSFYIDEQGEDLTAYSIVRLNSYLQARHKLFRAIMIYCFNKDRETEKLNQKLLSPDMFKNLMEKVLFPEDIVRTVSGTPEKPEILRFTANGKADKEFETNPGSKIVLEWEAKNTTSIHLLPENKVLSNNGTLTVEPYTDTTYSLHAIHKYRSMIKESKKSIDIDIYDPDLKKPTIDFNISGYQKRAYLLEQTQYTIKWKATDAQEIFLDGKQVPNNNSQIFVASKGGTYITHTIKAINHNHEKFKKSEAIVEVFTEKRPEVHFKIIPLIIESGKSIMLTWETTSGDNISILQDNEEIATQLKNSGSMEIILSAEKGKRSQITRFTMQAYSKWGKWPSDKDEQIVTIKRPLLSAGLIILLIILTILALAVFILYYRGVFE